MEHDFWLTLAREAPDEPEKVQLVALLIFAASGGGVIAGADSTTGEARTVAARRETTSEQVRETILAGADKSRYLFVLEGDASTIVAYLACLGETNSIIYIS